MIQDLINALQPPGWVVAEVQNRVVLLLNHVLAQEPQAQDRVRRQQGKTARLVWGKFDLALKATPAGLLERPPEPNDACSAVPDLTVTLTQTQLPDVFQTMLKGEKPRVSIDGDVQLAAEVAWLVDNLRWDLEEDLSRLMGDVPAAAFLHAAKLAADSVRAFSSRWLSSVIAGAAGSKAP